MIGLLGLSMAMIYTGLIAWDAFERNIPAAFDGIVRIGGVIAPIDRLVTIGISLLALTGFYVLYGAHPLGPCHAGRRAGRRHRRRRRASTPAASTSWHSSSRSVSPPLAGALYGQIYAVSPFMGERPLFVAFVVVILGGMGSIPGAALGGVLLGFTESLLGTLYGGSVAAYVSFGVVVLLLIFRPSGLLGKPE